MREDEALVKQAVMNYVDAIYNVDPGRIQRCVHPGMVKSGFFFSSQDGAYCQAYMTFDELLELARCYNQDGLIPSDAPKDVVVLDVMDQTASAKLTAWWGVDYMHLARYENQWMIVQILWQSSPDVADARERMASGFVGA